MTPRTYSTPEGFRVALEQRLRAHVPTGAEFVRKRQILVFDRFLARVLAVIGDRVVLKGGLALELRLERARTTKDVDLRLTGSPQDLLERLQEAGRLELGDFMAFEVTSDADHPQIQNDGMPYDGLRLRAACKIAGKLFGQEFGVDVAFGDPILGEPDVMPAEDVLAFAGIAPPVLRIYPIETHIAEKLHAYTQPRKRPNSRVKDLPDLALLATAQPLSAGRLRAALEQSFAFRGTHALPTFVPLPSDSWRTPYAAMAKTDELPWTQLEQVTEAVQTFIDPVLARSIELDSVWDPDSWSWRR
jgi:hypothetical protein